MIAFPKRGIRKRTSRHDLLSAGGPDVAQITGAAGVHVEDAGLEEELEIELVTGVGGCAGRLRGERDRRLVVGELAVVVGVERARRGGEHGVVDRRAVEADELRNGWVASLPSHTDASPTAAVAGSAARRIVIMFVLLGHGPASARSERARSIGSSSIDGCAVQAQCPTPKPLPAGARSRSGEWARRERGRPPRSRLDRW